MEIETFALTSVVWLGVNMQTNSRMTKRNKGN